MRGIDLALVGFGHVGRAFAELLMSKRQWLARRNIEIRVTWILTGSGALHSPSGIDTEGLLSFISSGDKISEYNGWSRKLDFSSLIAKGDFRTMIEMSPTDMVTGEPAMTHIGRALKPVRM